MGVARRRGSYRGIDGARTARWERAPRTSIGFPIASRRHGARPECPASVDRVPWAYFRADWKAVLWRIYKKMNDDRLLAVAAGVVFYGLLALFPAVTAFVSFYGLVADPSTIHEHLSLAAGILPQGALDILNEQLTRLTAHRTSALGLGFAGGLLFALWSANAGSKAIMDGLNVAYGESEKRSFIKLNLVALAFTLGAIFAFILALSAVVLAPIVLSHLGLGGRVDALVRVARWPALIALVFRRRLKRKANSSR